MSEPVFVARPDAVAEDDGVVISAIVDKVGEGRRLGASTGTLRTGYLDNSG